ncbi:YidC/Oxa1 family membrane protein insertase [Tyzzerella sp. OttesenSCG-928-J15]|nr:YidC/Oxa1 family membrane protein insertase [Tyzzerella sp. OttesenSCG-928-J15]
MIQKDPGVIVGPLSSFFGFILNVIYDCIYALSSSEKHTLGFAIIIMTIVAKLIMLPLNIKSQKSMQAMQKLQPEMEKIKAKYGDNPTNEQQQKMSMEVSQLYSKHKANPLTGCLPMFIQFPIFMALYYIMNQSHNFIAKLNEVYTSIASLIMGSEYFEVLKTLALPKLPNGLSIDLAVEADVVKVLGKFTQVDWDYLLSQVTTDTAASIETLLLRKQDIEHFFGIILTENTGFSWPSILIPIACVVFTFITSYMSNKQSKSTDPSVKMQQNIMLFGMPIMMGFITFGMPAGVGLYWATSNAIQIIQQYALTKYFSRDKNNDEIVDPKPAKKKK